MKTITKYAIEWKEVGKWVRGPWRYGSVHEAEQVAKRFGNNDFRIVPVPAEPEEKQGWVRFSDRMPEEKDLPLVAVEMGGGWLVERTCLFTHSVPQDSNWTIWRSVGPLPEVDNGEKRISELESENQNHAEHRLVYEARIRELEKERDALRVEYESRAEWIKAMNGILGYSNDDGFHSTPDPFEIAKTMMERVKELEGECREQRLEIIGLRSRLSEGNHQVL